MMTLPNGLCVVCVDAFFRYPNNEKSIEKRQKARLVLTSRVSFSCLSPLGESWPKSFRVSSLEGRHQKLWAPEAVDSSNHYLTSPKHSKNSPKMRQLKSTQKTKKNASSTKEAQIYPRLLTSVAGLLPPTALSWATPQVAKASHQSLRSLQGWVITQVLQGDGQNQGKTPRCRWVVETPRPPEKTNEKPRFFNYLGLLKRRDVPKKTL